MFSAVERVSDFSEMPKCAVLGSYGGGDAMQMSRQLLVLKLPSSSAPSSVKNILPNCIETVLGEQAIIPDDKKVAKLPDIYTSLDDEKWEFTVHFQISSHVYGESKLNLFNQAWLFSDVASDSSRRGATGYPLVGLFSPHDGIQTGAMEHSDVAFVGIDKLKWAEQHIHKVDDGSGAIPLSLQPWHFGTDMARFYLDQEKAVSSFWGVTVDLEKCKADFTYFLVVRGDLEDPIERLLRQHEPHDGKDGAVRSFIENFVRGPTNLAEHLSGPQQEAIASLMLA